MIEELVKKYNSYFWKKVEKTDSCWNWKGYITPKGYGRYGVYGKSAIYAHRFAFIDSGKKIPKEMVLDHICRNRACVNPKHLRIVTIKQNSTENTINPIAKNSEKTHCPKGHKYDLYFKGGRSCSQCRKLQDEKRIRLINGRLYPVSARQTAKT